MVDAETEVLCLPTPGEFPAFPYSPPYPIQVELMRHLYTSIEQSKVTIVESPTGTGKTLSLLCASLTWLSDERNRARKGILDSLGTEAEARTDWVLAQTRERRARDLEAEESAYMERLQNARKKEGRMRRMAAARVHKKQRFAVSLGSEDSDDMYLPDLQDPEDNISPEVRALMARFEKSRNGLDRDEEEVPTCTKIYYASRTHSQLTQIVPELLRLKLQPVTTSAPACRTEVPSKRRAVESIEDEGEQSISYTRTVSLGSRRQLCVNETIRAKFVDIDEGCRALMEEKEDKRCQYLSKVGDEGRMHDFRDQILASPKDIEDLASAGRLAQTCPYFGSRQAIPQAELVTLPYNLLLQKSAREALGIDLSGQIVIIDEAHNLIPTLLSLSTTKLGLSTLSKALFQLATYVSKFKTRLGATHLLHLKRLVTFLEALQTYLLAWKNPGLSEKPDQTKSEILTATQLVDRLGRSVSGINLLEIESYLKSSKIARKISGYSDKQAEKADPSLRRKPGAVPPLHAVEAFLLSLTGASQDGRVSLTLVRDEVELKYQLLNPAPHFMEVVESARSVVLAGGTMSPISDVIHQLFYQLPAEKVTSFSCGHIIPESNLKTIVVSKGPRGGELEYKAGKQSNESVVDELGQMLFNFASLIPKGMVVFFPSYNFLNLAKAAWRKSGILTRLEGKKQVFFEPEQTIQVDQVLQDYADAVSGGKGALLFAVIGAKLSEGLNFTDDLARAVIIIGLPFANLGSIELKERMRYVQELERQRGTKPAPGRKDAGAELYENLCMNAVNQSIGRAIRHRNDWAALILLDSRYKSTSIRSKLPKWIGGSLTAAESFGPVIKDLGAFYRSKRG
ncbi:unnamed protein product [Mycena citricolor]|uniref:ATP-dependent DNA helicase CHL1 n=1 Tax=Mycena citricolor TaxID=2018698 RepID=A0AAD2HY40_9AGAR|nr:unnamed protein product [Mycena citricolor]